MILHPDVSSISFKHKAKIKNVFSDILGLYNIEHFSLDLVAPNGEMLFFSSTPSHAYEICQRGYGHYDGIISPDFYEKNSFYWWEDASHKMYADKIKEIRENILNLRNGFMLVRKIDDFHIIYSFAERKKLINFKEIIFSVVNELLKMGDHVYMEMRDLYANFYCEYEPPEIERFYEFQGGVPEPMYTTEFIRRLNSSMYVKKNKIFDWHSNFSHENNIIYVDFKKKIVIS